MTRTVLVGRRWVVKLPGGWNLDAWHHGTVEAVIRGWLANRSEWRQRRRTDVNRPVLTVAHVLLVSRAADELLAPVDRYDDENLRPPGPWNNYELGDERKLSSWGRFGERWLLIDFDRSWQPHDRGLIGWWYFGRQERLARRWSKLPSRQPGRITRYADHVIRSLIRVWSAYADDVVGLHAAGGEVLHEAVPMEHLAGWLPEAQGTRRQVRPDAPLMGWGEVHRPPNGGSGTTGEIEAAHQALDGCGIPPGNLAARVIELVASINSD